MLKICLNGCGDFTEWRYAARVLLMCDVTPADVVWESGSSVESGLGFGESELPVPSPTAAAPSVPPAFLDLAQTVICHSNPDRFALLYRLLWRIRSERHLIGIVSDPDVIAARKLEKSVRRDSHKMKAFVRFKEVPSRDPMERRRAFFAWFEPDHYIVARMAPFFKRRFFDMDWVIATPKGSAAWDGEELTVSDEPAEKPEIRDDADDLWRIYYANIFNPARLKVKAMTAEMPKKYWKNLPEADLIPDLIANAEAKVREMAERAASQPPAFHQRLQDRMAAGELNEPSFPEGTLEALRQDARHCTRCELHCRATQTVFGEGSQSARVMFVGEQPGDQEDLAGRPFVGPAGKVFDTVVNEVGLDRREFYVTNAVKHFKYEPQGKRRIHQKPNQGEIQACRWWLTKEVELIKPSLVVAMGATAYYALTDHKEKLQDVRGMSIAMSSGCTLFVTVHPSYLLRIPDEARKSAEFEKFRLDMAAVRRLAQESPAIR
ncbi:UdgX family uracil-DNA binding protein [Rhizobium lemnae]|uniref:Type-4 uracil-DNA glycosylase n=1 Tax=Rhizobium lemnae TaxID=1214924 RepID=A0ABV8EA58_9HYPH|nr:UdgX family uracil-DNA binding protein [Rhizobium lemnae]MCJ8508729.1 UdgX family uracil-DNA binding protein [Rhizobium lemnae]